MYSAGTAFLTIVPSFVGIEEAIRDKLKRAAKDADDSMAAAMPASMRRAARAMAREGRNAGRDYASKFAGEVQSTLSKVDKLLGRGKGAAFDALRKDFESLRDQHIKVEIDDATALAAIELLRQRLNALKDQKVNTKFRTDLSAADVELQRLAQNMRAGLKALSEEAEDAGNRAGHRFAERFSAQVAKAAHALPRIDVDADTTKAERRIEAIRTALAALSGRTVGVGIDEGAAIAQLRALMHELQQLARSDPSISVRTDAAEAYAELVALDHEVRRLDGRRINLNVAVDGKGGIGEIADATDLVVSRLGALISVSLAIGPAIVPAAAAAAAAIGGIGIAAAAAAIGVGVLGLAFHGVVDAVKAQDAAADDAAKSNKSLSAAATAVANAQDGVENAERSLARARENAAYQAKQSARAIVEAQRDVRDAERGVTEAVKEQRRAQLDLIEAIKEAKRQNEDLTLSLEDNALAQRQATLDVADAKRELDKVLNNPKSTKEEREQARITYEERLLQQKRLGIEGKRLQEDQAKANREGIAGNKGVQAAQERVEKSTQAVANAQQRLADAHQKVADAYEAQQRQQRQSADAIVSAQRSLAQAQRSLAQATVNAGTAGGAAMDKLKKTMQDLTPAGQEFAKFVYGLKGEFKSLQGAAAENFLPKFETAIKNLLPYLPTLRDFIGDVASALGDVAIGVTKGLQNPTWKDFFEYIRTSAVPTIRGMATVTGNIATGLADLYLTLTPFNKPMGQGLIGLTEQFQAWAYSVKATQGYKDFLAYVGRVGPKVLTLLAELGQLAVHLVVALAPIGETVVDILTGIARALDAIPTGVLTVFLGGLATLGTVLLVGSGIAKTYTFIMGAWALAMKLWSGATDVATAAATRFKAATSGPETLRGAGEFSKGLGVMAENAEKSKGKLAGLSSFLGGPWGIAIAGATLLLGYQAAAEEEEQQRIAELKDGLAQLGEAYKRNGGYLDKNTNAIIAHNKELKALVLTAKEYGIAVTDIAAATAGDAAALNRVLDQLSARQQQLKAENEAFIKAHPEAGHGPWAISDETIRKNAEESRSIDEKKKALQEYAKQMGLDLEAQKLLNQATEDSTNANKAQEEAQRRATAAMSDASTKASLLRDAYHGLYDARISQQEAIENEAASLDRLRESYKQNGNTLSVSTAEGRANIDAVEDRIKALRDLELADIEATGTVTENTRKKVDAFEAEAVEMGFNQDEIKRLEKTYGLLDVDVVTDLILKGGVDEGNQLDALAKQMIRLIALYNITPAEAEVLAKGGVPTNWRGPSPSEQARGITNPVRKAEGGAVRGPGTETSDSIPALLSHNEHVWTAKEVHAAGGHAEVEAMRRSVLQRFATGGRVLKRSPTKDTAEVYTGGGGVLGGQFGDNANVTLTPAWQQFNTYFEQLMSKKQAELEADRQAKIAAAQASGSGGSAAGIIGDDSVTFPPWPSSPGASRGDSGVWKKIVALIKSTGPVSGEFGNAYRDGDPLWHGSGRAVDWMGYQQDALAQFLASRRPLELIHRTNKRDYAYTRGKDKGSFNEKLMNEHKNHVHIAMDSGGWLPLGLSSIYNGTGKPEAVLTNEQWSTLQNTFSTATGSVRNVTYNFGGSTIDMAQLRAHDQREAVLARIDRAH